MARGGSKAGRPRGPLPREVMVSKKLSWLLRHGAEKEGLKLGKGGYVNLAEVLANRNVKSLKVDLAEVKSIVAENEKQRFSLVLTAAEDGTDLSSSVETDKAVQASALTSSDVDPSHYLIRANQGHSLKLEDDTGLLTSIALEANNLPDTVVHGTRRDRWRSIVASGGLKPMGRNHVHFATGVPATLQSEKSSANPEEGQPVVLSGMRNSSTILMFLDLPRALSDGKLKFGLSTNGVVLTEGDQENEGLVSLNLFKRIEDTGGVVLLEDGKLTAEGRSTASGSKKYQS